MESMALRVRRVVKPRTDAKPDAPLADATVGTDFAIDVLEEKGDWRKIRATSPGGLVVLGWIKTESLVEREIRQVSLEIDIVAFLDMLTIAARRRQTGRDYLAAVAWVESGIRNITNTASGAIGPFQFLPRTWNGLVVKYGDELKLAEDDINNPLKQPFLAAALAKDNTDALVNLFPERRLPNSAELYLAHLLGLPAAKAVLSTPRTEPIDRPLLRLYADRDDKNTFVNDKIIGGNRAIFMFDDRIKTIEETLATLINKLNEGYARTTPLIAELPDDLRGVPKVVGTAPWMARAQEELAKNVVEIPGEQGSNPEIEKYFSATGFLGKVHDDVPWCAAFVSWCMANCDNAVCMRENLRSALAADWIRWGSSIPEPVEGAVAVLEPMAPKSSGHVGFVTAIDTDTVELLGGNQPDARGPDSVNRKKFSRSKVRDYRWLNLHDAEV
jgi:uncharacterized protein (TIGR02594 family)